MEFEVTTDLSVLPAAIECNADEVKAQLAEKLGYYNTLVVTEGSIREAKADKAALNKLRTAIDDRRKEIKRQCLAPYEAFEGKCKDLMAMIEAPIVAIDTQLKGFAEAVLIEKRDALQSHFDSITDGRDTAWIDLRRILNPKWKNATMKLETLKAELSEAVERLLSEEAELRDIYGSTSLYPAIRNKYLDTYDKGQTFAYAALLLREEQERRTAAPMPEPPAPAIPAKPAAAAESSAKAGTITGCFRVTSSVAQITQLRDYLRANGIAYEVVREN